MGEFRQAVDTVKLDSCISRYRQLMIQNASATTAQNQLARNDLAYSLIIGYIATDQITHLTESILLYRSLVAEVPSSRRIFPLLGLTAALIMHCIHFQDDPSVLQEAILLVSQFKTAFDDRNALLQQAHLSSKGLDDLEEAISLYSEALSFIPIRHQRRPALLNSLAMVLSAHYYSDHQLHYLEHAATLYRDATRCHSHVRGALFGNASAELAKALLRLYEVTHLQTHLNDAMDAFRDAANADVSDNSSRSTRRFNMAKEWAQSAHTYHHPSAMEAYRYAIKYLPPYSFGGKGSFSTRRSHLSAVAADGLACSAASCAIEMGRLEEAVELLEARSLFWTQAMQLRTPLDDLMRVSPNLAERLQNTTKILEESSLLMRTSHDATSPSSKEYLDPRAMNAQRAAILDEIRRLEGFHDFLLPKTFSSLVQAASNGTVVILIAATESPGCDALIITVDGCSHLPLKTIAPIEVKGLVGLLKFALSSRSTRYASDDMMPDVAEDDAQTHRLKGRRVNVNPSFQDPFRTVLLALWKHVVSPVIKHLKLQVK